MGDTIKLIFFTFVYRGNTNVNDLKLQTLAIGDMSVTVEPTKQHVLFS